MYKQLEFELTGVVPTLMNNGRTANPLDPIAREMKRFTGKRKKTEEDYLTISDLEVLASVYTSEPVEYKVTGNQVTASGGGKFVWPADNIEKMLVESAKKAKLGTAFKAAVFVEEDAVIEHDGPNDIQKFISSPKNRLQSKCKMGAGTSVMKSRAMFRNWKLRFRVNYLPDQINESDVREAVERAGIMIGLSDWRPRYGRFTAKTL